MECCRFQKAYSGVEIQSSLLPYLEKNLAMLFLASQKLNRTLQSSLKGRHIPQLI